MKRKTANIGSAAVAAVIVATAASLRAFAAEEKPADECSKYLDQMINDLNTLEALVPNVPPEEAGYLEKEYAAAITSGAGTRIYAIEHRPLFPAWNVHNKFQSARAILPHPPTVGAIKFRIQMASLIPHSMADAKVAWDKFQDADADNGQLLTLQQHFLGAYKSEEMIGAPGLYIWCLANLIPEPH